MHLLIEILNAGATLLAHSALSMQRHLRLRCTRTHTARTRPTRNEHVRCDNLPAPSPASVFVILYQKIKESEHAQHTSHDVGVRRDAASVFVLLC
jgi:hypothetical protein